MASRSLDKGTVTGIGTGAAAFVFGYLAVYVLTIDWVRDSGILQAVQTLSDAANAPEMVVGWVFFNAHGVTTTTSIEVFFFSGSDSVNFVESADALGPELYLIPPAFLLLAGFVAAAATNVRDTDGALTTGAMVTGGYLPLAVAAQFLTTVSTESSSGQPDLIMAVGLAGIVYPLIFGTIGALIASR